MEKYFVIDFDSTFTEVEALDVLGEISLDRHSEKTDRLQKIKDITDQGMDGGMTFRDSLDQRISLLNAKKSDLIPLIESLKNKVSKSFKRNRDFFTKYADHIYIISNGFKDFITPIVTEYGVKEEHIYANSFHFNENGEITGFDPDNVLSSNSGKVKVLKKLGLKGDVYVIGDGYTDYEIREAGLANKFYGFTENVERSSTMQNADHITPSLDEFLFVHKLNSAISYPKNRIKVLLLEGVHQNAVSILKNEGYKVEVCPDGLSEDELCEKIKGVSIVGIRSKTNITQRVLESADRLMAVGAFCIGTNQIDLEACLRKGVAVFNAPFSNTRSVVELALSEIIMLMRNLPDKIVAMHEGKWQKSAASSFEIRGKKIGIIGYGNIGAQLSVLAESFGLDVYYYDIVEKLALGNATKCESLKQLLETVDIVTLHIDGRPENSNVIGRPEFEAMKDGVVFINLSRGAVVDIAALEESVLSGKVKGVAVDVFPEEPISNDHEFINELRGLPNTILTPHIGGSTIEAQANIAEFVPGKIMQYVNSGSTSNSVNFPNLQLPTFTNSHRLIHIHENIPGILADINNTLAAHDVNIIGQYLKTNESIGYVITDIDKEYNRELTNALKKIGNTIKFRVLY